MNMDKLKLGIIVGLEYLLQFKERPLDYVQIMADAIMQQRGIRFPPEDVVVALGALKCSDIDLSTLLPQPHSDATLREFFSALELRLSEILMARK
jgi:hypothetical protein